MRRSHLPSAVAISVGLYSALACSGLPTGREYVEKEVVERDPLAQTPAGTELVNLWYGGMDDVYCTDCPPDALEDGIEIVASSSLPPSARGAHEAEAALDDDPDTAWCAEGGVGEWLELRFAEPVDVEGIGLFGGFFESEFQLFRHQRVHELLLTADEGPRLVARIKELPRGRQAFVEARSQPAILDQGWMGIRSMRLDIRDTHPGREGLGLCISSIEIVGRPSR